MNAAAPTWGTEALWHQLSPLLPGLGIEVVASVASTNSVLLERARGPRGDQTAGGAPPFGRRAIDGRPHLLVAEHQSAGRGRLGRHWRSSAGASLTFSLALPLEADDWSGLSLAVGVALADALEPDSGVRPRIGLKWPNDLWLVDAEAANGVGRKLGGILIETVASEPRRRAVIGVGLNVLPLACEQAGEFGSGYAALQELLPGIDPPGVLARVARPLVEALQQFERKGLHPFIERFAARDVLRGRAVTATPGSGAAGLAGGIAEDGALQLDTGDGVLRIGSGEVSVRLQPRAGGGRG